jgi:glycosyltransferase involved in cell wall biosynthesis
MRPERLRVLQVVGDPVGGTRRHVHGLLAGLDPQRFSLFYAYSTRRCDARFREEIASLRRRLAGELPLSVAKGPGPRDLVNLARLARFSRAQGISVVHGHGAKGGAYARLLSRLCGLKSVYTPHGGAVHRMFSPLADAMVTATERLLLPLTDFLLFESEHTARAYQAKLGRLPARWAVNHNGIAEPNIAEVARRGAALAYPAGGGRAVRVGVFGMLRPEKGQEYAVRAAAVLARAGKPVAWHFFGDGPDRGRLEGLVRELGLQGRVSFHGDVADVDAHLWAMDLVLIPSLFESFGLTAVEAMALGKPVVASRVGGLSEVLSDGQTGCLVAPRDAGAISRAVSDFLDEPARWSAMAEAGRRDRRRRFSQERMVAAAAAVYDSLA